jgi:hypothetical protein
MEYHGPSSEILMCQCVLSPNALQRPMGYILSSHHICRCVSLHQVSKGPNQARRTSTNSLLRTLVFGDDNHHRLSSARRQFPRPDWSSQFSSTCQSHFVHLPYTNYRRTTLEVRCTYRHQTSSPVQCTYCSSGLSQILYPLRLFVAAPSHILGKRSGPGHGFVSIAFEAHAAEAIADDEPRTHVLIRQLCVR